MYGTVEDWITYAALRGTTVANDAASLQALQRASDYIRTRYVIRLAPDYDETSEEVIEAAYIAASFELSTPGFWSTVFTPSQTKVLTKGPEVEWTPIKNSLNVGVDGMRPTHADIEALFYGQTSYNLGPLVV